MLAPLITIRRARAWKPAPGKSGQRRERRRRTRDRWLRARGRGYSRPASPLAARTNTNDHTCRRVPSLERAPYFAGWPGMPMEFLHGRPLSPEELELIRRADRGRLRGHSCRRRRNPRHCRSELAAFAGEASAGGGMRFSSKCAHCFAPYRACWRLFNVLASAS